MSQKTILSFFKSSDQTASSSGTKKKQEIEDSPVKTTRSKRKVKCIESDDESLDNPAESVNGDSGQTNGDTKNKKTKFSNQSSPKVSVKEKKDKQTNGVSGSKKSPRQKKIEKEGDRKSPRQTKTEKEGDRKSPRQKKIEKEGDRKSPRQKKIEKESSSKCISEEEAKISDHEQKSSETGKDEDSSSKACVSSDTNHVEFIPKRKTARKQINSARNGKRNGVQKVKEEVESNSSDGGKEINKDISSKSDTVSQEQLDVEMKEVEITSSSEEKESSPLCNGKDSEKEPESKNVSCDTEKSVDVKPKGKNSKGGKSPVKKSAKTESIHSFFMPRNQKTAKKSVEDKKEEMTDKEENQNKLKYAEETKAEKESKKANEKDSKKSQKSENDDSPVKKARKQKKKIRGLESDDEEEDKSDPVEEHVKMETDDTEENTDISSEKGKEKSSSSGKTSESIESKEKKSPCKKSEETDSKNTKEKQKLSLKSTSASGTVYDPSKNHYHPIEDACWKKDEKVPYLALAKTMELIENTSGRLKTIEILANFFRSVIILSPDDLLQSVYLCLNRIAPEYEGIELGVGETLLMKAVAQATGRTLDKIKAEVAAKGDLGLVSESSRGNQRVMFAPPKLTVSSVFSKFFEIAKMSGNSAMAKKIDKIQSLFVACRECEARYIIRSLSGKLRIGLAEQSVLSAVARAAVQTPPTQAYPPEVIDASKKMSADSFKELVDSQALILKTAYCECPNYDLIIPVLLKEGISALPDRCQLSPGRPLKPMLAHPTAGIDKVLERFDKNAFTCEFKYDGERAQIHMTDKGEVKIFSRNQEDNTSKYPDVISRISKALKETTKSFILDSEAVAWDKETKQILPFQVLSTRKRKDAVESEIVVQVCIVAFDLLYLNGESLVKKPLKERRSLLHSFFNEVENEFMFAQYKDGNSAETMQEFLDESVKGNCEGLMVKSLEVDASYEIAKRSHNWLKLKKDYLQGVGDTLDLIVIGGYYGKGKRTGNYGGFLLACYDEDNEEYQSICKLGTGFKDDILEAHTTFLKQHVIPKPKSYFRYDHSLEPDEWFEPVQVWEIKCADLSISPVHKAAIGIIDPEKGISLRFPRFIRIRDDKTPENGTNSVQIADMYQKQQQIQNTTNKNSKAEEDYY